MVACLVIHAGVGIWLGATEDPAMYVSTVVVAVVFATWWAIRSWDRARAGVGDQYLLQVDLAGVYADLLTTYTDDHTRDRAMQLRHPQLQHGPPVVATAHRRQEPCSARRAAEGLLYLAPLPVGVAPGQLLCMAHPRLLEPPRVLPLLGARGILHPRGTPGLQRRERNGCPSVGPSAWISFNACARVSHQAQVRPVVTDRAGVARPRSGDTRESGRVQQGAAGNVQEAPRCPQGGVHRRRDLLAAAQA